MFGAASIVSILCAAALAHRAKAPQAPAVPSITPRGEYVSSSACKSCHPSEHASFSGTFHRTMTQRADAVVAPVGTRDGVTLERRDDGVWASAAREGAPERIVLTTGSHHVQALWTDRGRAGELSVFPFVWLVAEKRWIARRDAFLEPPDAPSPDVHWSSNCIQCHAVVGEPRREGDTFAPRVAELGIACEACHGPGGEHVARHRDPIERTLARSKNQRNPSIVNPARLEADRASEVCGQCHAYAYPRDEEEWWSHGYARTFRPGASLDTSRTLLTDEVLRAGTGPSLDRARESIYWGDGTMRVGGREWNGLSLSACRTRGTGGRRISCLSCHSMHQSDPDDQLARDRLGDEACLTCHGEMRASRERHTHHAERSPGAACVSCHMPKTSYALLGAIRSHRIDVPNVAVAERTGRPLACNLCHLDKSLAWSQAKMTEWYGVSEVALDARDRDTSEAVDLALRGDAAQRAIVAASLGDGDAMRASGVGWQDALLDVLARDPYAAVRTIAERSRVAIDQREPRKNAPALDPERARALLLLSNGSPDRAAFDAELAARDARPISISE